VSKYKEFDGGFEMIQGNCLLILFAIKASNYERPLVGPTFHKEPSQIYLPGV
jgi:hypothetical protein